MCFGGPTIPQATAPPGVATVDASVQAALDADRKRRAANDKTMGVGNTGFNSTVLAGGLATPATSSTAMKTTLGA
jgi:hypothetical protein